MSWAAAGAIPADAWRAAVIFAAALAVVGAVSLARRAGALGPEAGRKTIHILVGFIPFAVAFAIEDFAWALFVAGAFVLGNVANRRWNLFPAMAGDRPADLGTIFYPLALTGLVAALWHSARPLVGIAMGPMIWGDAAAAIAGERWGRHPLVDLPGHRKTWEGTAAMALASFAWLWLTAGPWFPAGPGGAGPPAPAALAAVAAALAAVEAASPHGLDNLAVPWIGAVLLVLVAADPAGAAVRLWLGLAAATAVAWIAERRGALDRGGTLGATVVGTLVFAAGGLAWAMVLVAYFAATSALGRLRGGRRQEVEAYAAKSGRRDLGQVLANGAVAAAAALVAPWTGAGPAFAAFTGALAASAADTWATEVGGLSRRPPRLITTGREVAPGTSGAVTWLGLAGSAAGAAFVGLVADLAASSLHGSAVFAPSPGGGPPAARAWIWVAAVSGMAGSLLDSLLGATLQAVRRCPSCGEPTERAVHGCGTATVHARGLRWLGNDLVNLICTAAGACVGWAAWSGYAP